MIGRLQGRILAKHPPQLLLDVGGVGYEIEAPMSTFYDLPAVGETVTLVTHLAVREDAWSLYGFGREQERALFRRLLKVTGVGAKMALAILSSMDAARFAQCIEHEDLDALVRVPGIGRKTAQRLVMELRDSLDVIPGSAPHLTETRSGSADPREQALADAVSALVALGYRPVDATRMTRAADDGNGGAEEIIRSALRSASQK
ncbi:Holliday junction branch migration protein RuvA [Thiocapsa marina]|uniref:Holliday junction branch migration complex subunit RuvA n=1 Tax=Thiocapsa marina 5811 TaxID=768671 RepID=F9U8I2_9GAMM|nr:Holliday junction branch migration protein RuvA [Thiocapsa marina]EGV19594.1 Holliday junction ATP-dependent DNA helicase ruvA [Thiocapsa marina 5811]